MLGKGPEQLKEEKKTGRKNGMRERASKRPENYTWIAKERGWNVVKGAVLGPLSSWFLNFLELNVCHLTFPRNLSGIFKDWMPYTEVASCAKFKKVKPKRVIFVVFFQKLAPIGLQMKNWASGQNVSGATNISPPPFHTCVQTYKQTNQQGFPVYCDIKKEAFPAF